jgi:EAL domain-containing protein (putative c-di-GMP-specific phosphodiesterase class I)
VALYPDHAQDPDTLVQRAEVAMYLAKRRATDVSVYSSDLDRSSVRRLTLLGELRRAIHEGELELHYQPSLDLRTGEVRSVEALVRWRHPEHGLLPPSEFIELAEISGLIGELTRWVLTEAVRAIRSWGQRGLTLRVAVNLSVRNLADATLVPWLGDLLDECGVDPSLVKLEVTESELMDDPAAAMELLEEVRTMGSSTSIDDFGTGYSSLAYLKHLPVDELKIDRSFVAGMVSADSDLTIVRSTIDLAHNLGLDVVAEGVEDVATLRRLAELGCDRAQGYFISRPVPAAACTIWLTDDGGLADVVRHLPAVPVAAGDDHGAPVALGDAVAPTSN